MKNKFYLLIYFLFVISSFFLLVITFLFSYNTVLSLLADFLNVDAHKLALLLSIAKYYALKIFIFFVICTEIVIYIYRRFILNSISYFMNYTKYAIRRRVKLMNIDNAWPIFVLPFSCYFYFLFTIPVSYDEAWTYLNFSSRSVLSSISYYPAPNNHILYSILTNFFMFLPVNIHLIGMRIPALIISIVGVFTFYCICKEYEGIKFAMLASAIFSVLYMTIYYGYMARGYSLITLSFILSLYAVLKIKQESKNIYWIYFTISNIIGFYTIPSFLYAFITLNIVLAVKKEVWRKQVIYDFVCVLIVGMLYIPIIIISGLSSLTSNSYVKPISRVEVIKNVNSFFFQSLQEIAGINKYLVLFILVSAIVFIAYKKEYKLLSLFILFLIIPYILLIAHSVIPFSRTFVYYTCVIAFAAAYVLNIVFVQVEPKYIRIIYILLQIFLIFSFVFKVHTYEDYSFKCERDINEISDAKLYIVNSGLFDAYLLFNLKLNNKSTKDITYFNSKMVNADTMVYHYDFFITDKAYDKSISTVPYISNEYYNIYKRNSVLKH